MIDLTVTPDRVHHRRTKEETMNNNLHAPYLADRCGDIWKLRGEQYRLSGSSEKKMRAEIDRDYGPVTALWPTSTPNNTVLPDLSQWHEVPDGATIPDGTAYVSTWEDGSLVSGRSGHTQLPGDPRRFTEQPIPAPDPDAEWVDAIVKADNPEVARTLIATIRGEQA